MRGIEREFGLRSLAPSRDAERRAATRGEIEKQIRTEVVSTRIQLQRLADVASKDCASFSEYRERLRAVGVELEPILQQEGAKLTGLMYRLGGVTMKGSDLGKGYSPAGLAKRGVSYERSRDAMASLGVAKKTKPKRVRPSRAQTLPKLDLSGLEAFAKEQDARDRSQAALKEGLAEAERAKAFLAQEAGPGAPVSRGTPGCPCLGVCGNRAPEKRARPASPGRAEGGQGAPRSSGRGLGAVEAKTSRAAPGAPGLIQGESAPPGGRCLG